jgi:hypothetical protein
VRTSLRVIVALITILSLVLPAATSFAAASLSLSSNTGAIGATTAVSGSGFAPNTTVRILFDGTGGTLVGSESTDGSGNLPSLTVTVPNVTGGPHQVVATDGSNSASTTFNVSFSLTLTPAAGGPGTTIGVLGAGFLAGEPISVAWDTTGNQVTTATANGNGAFSASFAAPNGTGNHLVIATGQTSGFSLATTFFMSGSTSVGGAGLTINPISGASGSQINLTGTGFGASEQVNLAVDGNVFTSVTSDGSGNFMASVALPSSPGFGDRTISATGVSSGHSASVVFTVTSGRGDEGERGPVTCTSDNTRRGNGEGDRNHCHTGSQGEDQNHNHGHENQGGDDQGEDD